MTPEFVTSLGVEALKMIGLLAGPLLLAGLAVGLLVSVFQAVTSIQEMTLTFIPKMVVVGVLLLFLLPWMLDLLTGYTARILTEIPLYIR
ncbi:MAG: flagellar biosynthesis protein FliQ [Candidatus Tectomicrobia bacterium]|nr:flagellar biosynthesis protein FliQ [Candidatus Tectomicrobia bacterium]